MRKLFLSLVTLFFTLSVFSTNPPDEGMWLPMFIKDYNYATMSKLGLKLTPEQLYDINNSSLKDAIVQLGNGFCTGEMVSSDGLMFTNHHCGYQFIVEHSTMEHDYLNNGFWAMNRKDELQNPGFFVNFLVRMEDVTENIMSKITPDMKKKDRTAAIKTETDKLKKVNSEDGKYNVVVKSFYEGNEYYMFVYVTYKDVRLVGAPPASIGKFGGDTDNWMWPRHTGDFSIFRIYTAPDGSPAEYNENNVPLHPKHHLPISLKGIEQGDYTMIWGYPGTTERFMTSYEVKNTISIENPAIVTPLDYLLPIIRENMNASTEVQLNYADHFASLANMWKNKKGETESLIKLRVAENKAHDEVLLNKWINDDNSRKAKWGNVIANIDTICGNTNADAVTNFYYANMTLMTSKTLFCPWKLNNVEGKVKNTKGKEKIVFDQDTKDQILANYRKEMDGVDVKTETELIEAAVALWKTAPMKLNVYQYIAKNFKEDVKAYAKAAIEKSIFGNEANLKAFLDKPTKKAFDNDPLLVFYSEVIATIFKTQGIFSDNNDKLATARHDYLAALKEMRAATPMYPDANSTMRVTYGTVEDYYPADGVHYNYFTTSKGILEKEKPGDPEFDVPAKLKELIINKDFGQYANKNGELPVCFLSNNDITGGNSGSPIMNANGELIGLAFDGNWEALSSDIVFNTELQRCINVDVRYVLFIIDKFAGAGHLLNEMTIVK